jgi:hypothetical protein
MYEVLHASCGYGHQCGLRHHLRVRADCFDHLQWAATSKAVQQQGLANESTGSPVNAAFDVHAHTHVRNTFAWLHAAWESVLLSFIGKPGVRVCTCLRFSPETANARQPTAKRLRSTRTRSCLRSWPKRRRFRRHWGSSSRTTGQFVLELLEFDKSEANGVDEIAKDNEIVVESLAAQGLLRDTHRALMLEIIKTDELLRLAVGRGQRDRLSVVARKSDKPLTVSERRTGRANLLIVQHLKAEECYRAAQGSGDENPADAFTKALD